MTASSRRRPHDGQARAQVVDGGQRLGVLVPCSLDEEEVSSDAGLLQRTPAKAGVEVGHAGLAHDRDTTAIAEERARLGERAATDEHVVGCIGQRDRHPFHALNSFTTAAATSSTDLLSVSTSKCAAAS